MTWPFDNNEKLTPAGLGEAIADWLANGLDGSKLITAGPLSDGTTVLVMQPEGDHLMIQVNKAELVIR